MVPVTALSVTDGRWTVPGNRWDLVADIPGTIPRTSVVVPYFQQQRQLELLLTALTLQDYPAEMIQVVIADDGSATPPNVEAFREQLDLTVVSQADSGFRAAAARNLGAAASDGTVLCFLDADTIPEPGYLAASVRLPSLLPEALVVGRRRHGHFTGVDFTKSDFTGDDFAMVEVPGWNGSDVHAWFSGLGPPPTELTEPQWLRDGYRTSRDLLDADRRSYRFIISAVMSCSRELFDSIGGFDESFQQYGGEDWDFAHRAYDAGAVLAHEPAAVAWHDGPEWAERIDGGAPSRNSESKNGEAMALASRITDPAARRHGLRYAISECVAVVDTAGHTAASLLVTVGSILRGGDAMVWLHGEHAGELRERWGDADPRIRVARGDGADIDTDGSALLISVRGRIVFGDSSLALLREHDNLRLDLGQHAEVVVRSSRAIARSMRWAIASNKPSEDVIELLFPQMRFAGASFDVRVHEGEPTLSW